IAKRNGSEGLLYTLEVVAMADEDFATDSLITWNETGPDSLVDPIAAKTNLSCNNINQQYYGFVTDLNANKKMTGIVFLPIAREFKLQFHCKQGSATITTKANDKVVIQGQRINAGDSRQSIALAKTELGKEDYSFSKLLEEIKSGKMCITKINKDGLDLKWNIAKWVSEFQKKK
ncbi:MAG: hypothetical protein QGI60_01235, partial [archaeon]|nr:hypothetical protein [archaeon]